LTRRVESFDTDAEVGVYVCGITPYDTTHLGHARTYLTFDVLVRHLEARGHTVRYIQNITDIDESIVARAAELGTDYRALGDRYIDVYLEDMRALGVRLADAYPRATDAIPRMIEVTERLLGAGHAYQADGDVFFRVGDAEDFGQLSRLSRERMLEVEAAQDGSTVNDPRKEDPLDFPLWIAAAGDEPGWDSPWGRGRPGWHLECSTLAIDYLGPQIDIHGGGTDLVFPHHECEIAQSEALSGVRPFVRFWVHAEMARLGGKKMSKSDGNMVFVRDLLGEHSPDALRLYLLRTHYRSPLEFDENALGDAAALAARLVDVIRLPGGEGPAPLDAAGHEAAFTDALDDDLDTPRAVTELDALGTAIEQAHQARRPVGSAQQALRRCAERVGLRLAYRAGAGREPSRVG
jgi:L-cysteine:1D-myo-inositol 2-amino-2-deoxy-alpha-D-glucopyranoside ligase